MLRMVSGKPTKKNDRTYLTLNTTKDALKNAPGFKYDRQSTTWVPDKRASNDKPLTQGEQQKTVTR
jgi:hypothetical protein